MNIKYSIIEIQNYPNCDIDIHVLIERNNTDKFLTKAIKGAFKDHKNAQEWISEQSKLSDDEKWKPNFIWNFIY